MKLNCGRNVLVALAVMALAAARLPAQVVVGGTTETRLWTLLDPAYIGASTVYGTLLFSPTFSASSDWVKFNFKGSVSFDAAETVFLFSLDSLELDIDAADFMTIRLGRFSYLPGTASFLSPTNYLGIVDYEALLQGRLVEAVLPADVVQARFFLGDFFLILTAAPFPRRAALPAADSPWLPRKDLPASIHITFPTDQDLVLENIFIQDTALPAATLAAMGACVELGASLESVDVSALYYHGFDPSPLVQAGFDFPHGLFQGYDVILTPVDRLIDAFGLNGALSVSVFRMAADFSFTLSKSFMTDHLSSETMATVQAAAPYLEGALGAGFDLEQPRLSVEVEWKGSWTLAAIEDPIAPMLSQALFARAALTLWEGKVSLGAYGVVSLADGSALAMADFTFSPSSELSFQLMVPFFFGAANTDLGQFAGNHLITVSAAWRF